MYVMAFFFWQGHCMVWIFASTCICAKVIRGSWWILSSLDKKWVKDRNWNKTTLKKILIKFKHHYVLLVLFVSLIPSVQSDKWVPSIKSLKRKKPQKNKFYWNPQNISILRMSCNLTVLCGTVKPWVWMSEDIAMCVEGSSCYTWRAEWCEQEVTWGFAVCRALLTLLRPGTLTYPRLHLIAW